MLSHPTLEKLRELRLLGMARAFQEQLELRNTEELSFEERLALLVDREAVDRDHRRYLARLRNAKLRVQAALEDLDTQHPRGLDKALVRKLASCQWITDHRNVIITGPTGVGKTFIACALAHQACRQHHSVRYARVNRLLQELVIAKGDGRYLNVIEKLAKTDLLVLDDWGLEPFTAEHKRILLEIIDDRFDRRATLISSQLPTDLWYEHLADPTLADAILDRLVHHAYRLELKGESLRKNNRTLTRSPAHDS